MIRVGTGSEGTIEDGCWAQPGRLEEASAKGIWRDEQDEGEKGSKQRKQHGQSYGENLVPVQHKKGMDKKGTK